MDKDLEFWQLDESEFQQDWSTTALGVAYLLKHLALLTARVEQLEAQLAER
jgi:uncharacterized small protein (DUF1192 family)